MVETTVGSDKKRVVLMAEKLVVRYTMHRWFERKNADQNTSLRHTGNILLLNPFSSLPDKNIQIRNIVAQQI